jgi:hypothetical protein
MPVARYRSQSSRQCLGIGIRHLVFVEQRTPHLLLERRGAAVQEPARIESDIEQAGRVAPQGLAAAPDRGCSAVHGKAMLGHMAADAGHRAVEGQQGIVEQRSPEGHFSESSRWRLRVIGQRTACANASHAEPEDSDYAGNCYGLLHRPELFLNEEMPKWAAVPRGLVRKRHP